jgi:lipopolysaccharide transport system ATP-binding protein
MDQALLLDRWRLIQEGPPDRVVDYYKALIAKREASQAILQSKTVSGRMTTRSGTFEAGIESMGGSGHVSSSCRRSSRRRPGS